MFTLKKKYGEYLVDIQISSAPIATKGDQHFFGFVLNFDEIAYKTFLAQNFAKLLKGNWLCIEEKEDRLSIYADLAGGFRLYSIQIGRTLYLSDDYLYLLEKSGLPIEKNIWEYDYWQKHGYCTGGRTFIKGLDKLKPASLLRISAQGFKESTLFEDLAPRPHVDRYFTAVENDLRDTFACLHRRAGKEKVVLFFSGSENTVLLAKLLQLEQVAFEAVFLQAKNPSEEQLRAEKRAKKMAYQLGMALHILNFEDRHLMISPQRISQHQLFDRLDNAQFYYELQAVVERFGKDIVVIHGQHAHQVLNAGLSKDYLAYLQRYILCQDDFFSKMAAQFLAFLYREPLRMPRDEKEQQLAHLDAQAACRLMNQKTKASYYDYLSALIEEQAMEHFHLNTRLMYNTIYTTLQGSDQQIIREAANYLGVKAVLLPFTSAKVIYATMRHKSGKRGLAKPNYCVRRILEKQGIKYPQKIGFLQKLKPIYQLLVDHRFFKEPKTSRLAQRFLDYAAQLLSIPVQEHTLAREALVAKSDAKPSLGEQVNSQIDRHSGTFQQYEYAN